MATLIHLTAVFQLANLKEASIGLDFETNLATQDSEVLAVAQAGCNGWSGAPNLRASFASECRLLRVDAFAFNMVANPGTPPPNFVRDPVGNPQTCSANLAGTAAGESTLPQCAMVVTFKTAVSARTAIGRCYLPPPPNASVAAAGTLESTYQQTLIDRFDDWVTGIQNALVAPQTVSHTVVSGKLGTEQNVTDRILRGRIDTQRRRLTREAGSFAT